MVVNAAFFNAIIIKFVLMAFYNDETYTCAITFI